MSPNAIKTAVSTVIGFTAAYLYLRHQAAQEIAEYPNDPSVPGMQALAVVILTPIYGAIGSCVLFTVLSIVQGLWRLNK